MKILTISDEECQALWDYYVPGRLKDYDLIISCGDLKADYLSFLVTMARCPVLYVHGNHDGGYDRRPPEGCDCIDGRIVEYNGVRILGLGGCYQYHPGKHQYTEGDMARRIQKLRLPLYFSKGVDIVVTHAPPKDLGDAEDRAHWGFQCFRDLMKKYHPQYLLHGHVHMTYGQQIPRVIDFEDTHVVNAYERYVIELPDREVPPKKWGRLIWKNREPKRIDN